MPVFGVSDLNKLVEWVERELLQLTVYNGRLCREFKELVEEARKESIDEVDKCKRELREQFKELVEEARKESIEKCKRELKEEFKELLSHAHDLKEPKSEAQLTALRGLITVFNNKCARVAKKEGVEDIKWGDDNEFSVINSIESATAWFASPHAAKFKLGPQTLRDYEVFVFDGELVTLNRSYKGGTGMELLWTSDEVYRKKFRPSTTYETDFYMATDPRRKYAWKGEKFSPKRKKRKRR